MIQTPNVPRCSTPAKHRGLPGLLALFLCTLAPVILAQTDDFNDGNDSGWTRYTLPAYGAATYSFPDYPGLGKAYRILAPATGDDPYGMQNARAGSFRASPTYTGRFSLGSDLLAWRTDWREDVGLLFYFQDVGAGTSDGYAATYSTAWNTIYISLIYNEWPSTVGKLPDGAVVTDPTHAYRMEVSSHDGSLFLFQLFDKADLNNPWATVVAQDNAATYNAGLCGYLVYAQDYPSTNGADAMFDNYAASVPAAGSMPAIVTDLVPTPGSKWKALQPSITVGILNRDTSVDPASIVLAIDGTWISNDSLSIDAALHKPSNPDAFPNDFLGATASYTITNPLPWGTRHTNTVAFRDSSSVWRTNKWTWTSAYPYLFASNSLPLGSLKFRGFDCRMVQSDNNGQTLDNSLGRALKQLAVPPQIPIDRSATSIVQVLDWSESGSPNVVPGLCPSAINNIAVDSMAYLELTPGLHRFKINSDDRAGIYSGTNPADLSGTPLWENTANTANTTFDFVVESAGLYPVRCIWEETGVSSRLYMASVDLSDNSETVVNDPTDPPGVVKAWYPVVCKSSSNATGPYTATAMSSLSGTITNVESPDCPSTQLGMKLTMGVINVPVSANAQFYCIDAPRKTRITSVTHKGTNVEIGFTIE